MSDIKILFVDDDEMLRMIIPSCLKGVFGGKYQVICAADGFGALEIVKNEKGIRLVITDCDMPKMNGLDLDANIEKYYPDIKVIMMSGMHHEEDIANRGLHCYFILKGIDGDRKLCDAIRELLENTPAV
ncbi:response regulator [Candidatus Wolfebacteria bacterium]|nr:response regulator [Candidatus Wolfebacteria bacterium]